MAEILLVPSKDKLKADALYKKQPCNLFSSKDVEITVKPFAESTDNLIDEAHLYALSRLYIGGDTKVFIHNTLLKEIGVEEFFKRLSFLPFGKIMFEYYSDGSCMVIIPKIYEHKYSEWISKGAKI